MDFLLLDGKLSNKCAHSEMATIKGHEMTFISFKVVYISSCESVSSINIYEIATFSIVCLYTCMICFSPPAPKTDT